MPLDQISASLCSLWGTDRDAANAAWASSFDKELAEAKSEADVRRVVTNLVNLGHDTPKERVWLDYHITCPIFVERQFDKYRMCVQYQDFHVEYYLAPFGRDGITQNELSGRYRTIPDRPYGMPRDVAEIVFRANNHDLDEYPDCTIEGEAERWDGFLSEQHDAYRGELNTLKGARDEGRITPDEYKRAREVLRGILGTAYLTDMRVVMNMNAFEHIIAQRLDRTAQLESRVVAYHMVTALRAHPQCPSVMLEGMVKRHGWEGLLTDVEAHLNG